jgi:hypothetical protein
MLRVGMAEKISLLEASSRRRYLVTLRFLPQESQAKKAVHTGFLRLLGIILQ